MKEQLEIIKLFKLKPRREVNMDNPFECFAYYLSEGSHKNIVLTTSGIIFESTQTEMRTLNESGYYISHRREIEKTCFYDDAIYCALEVYSGVALGNSHDLLIESNTIKSPFINLQDSGEQK